MWRKLRLILLAGLALAMGFAGTLYFFGPVVNMPILAGSVTAATSGQLLARLKPAAGWRVSIHATGLGRARLMQLMADGSILVSTYRDGTILKVAPDGGVAVAADGLDAPHGLLLEGDQLYVAEESTVRRWTFDGSRLSDPQVVVADIPTGGHSSRTIARGPDGLLYLSIGSSCNVCIEKNDWRAAMLRFKEGETPEVFASGLRNSVGFDWQPGSDRLFAVNAGRDLLGDDFPPEELNHVEAGHHYGWPYANGPQNTPDPDLGDEAPAGVQFTPPVHTFTAHSTPLSIRFLRHQAGIEPGRVALVARHGSWNRSKKSGYDVRLVRFSPDGTISDEPFITGFEKNENVVGRPVDIVEAPNGDIFISDDHAGVIYRVRRDGA